MRLTIINNKINNNNNKIKIKLICNVYYTYFSLFKKTIIIDDECTRKLWR